MSAARPLFALMLILALLEQPTAAAAEPEYSSRSACLRADSAARCDKLFPEPKRSAAVPDDSILLLDTCTGILDEAEARMHMATAYLRFDSVDEAISHERQGLALWRAAMQCVRDANRATPRAEAEWKAQLLEYDSEAAILEAAKRARP